MWDEAASSNAEFQNSSAGAPETILGYSSFYASF